jgi:serine/threonine protein kinase
MDYDVILRYFKGGLIDLQSRRLLKFEEGGAEGGSDEGNYSLQSIYLIAMSLKDFVILSKLGEGAYSTVYKVQRIADSQVYALKKIKMVKRWSTSQTSNRKMH